MVNKPKYWQFLEVAVGNVVAAPVRHCVELDAMGELHLVLLVEPAALLVSLGALTLVPACAVLFGRDGVVLNELKRLLLSRDGPSIRSLPPSPPGPCRVWRSETVWCRNRNTIEEGGGLGWWPGRRYGGDGGGGGRGGEQ
jgi:hypothetical protein